MGIPFMPVKADDLGGTVFWLIVMAVCFAFMLKSGGPRRRG